MSTNENSRRVLIAIDPGYSTGVAVFINERLIEVFTSTTPHARLRNALAMNNGEVICEVGPLGRSDWAQKEVEDLVRLKRETCHFRLSWYRPSDWKPHPASRTHPREGNRHERDAVGMGRYHIATSV